jgi:hypothetical protein
MIGQVFSRLTILEKLKDSKYLCQCSCGNTKEVSLSNLKKGNTKSCGCLKKEETSKRHRQDLTALVFGFLKAERALPLRENSSHVFWHCVCSCGSPDCKITTSVSAGHLRTNHTKSCGALKNAIRTAEGESILKVAYNRIRKRHLAKWEESLLLSRDCHDRLAKTNCFYCGCEPIGRTKTGLNGGVAINGLDRIDNRQGYSEENTCSCCALCNWMKNNETQGLFLEWAVRLVGHIKADKCYDFGYPQCIYKRIEKTYKHNAKARSLIYDLSLDVLTRLVSSDCHYCGNPPSLTRIDIHPNDVLKNGIDRIDNSKGYSEENCVPSCFMCNRAKKGLPLDLFLSHVNKIALRHSKPTKIDVLL